MKKTVWTFGLIAGTILSLMMVVTLPFHDSIGDAGLVIGYTTMVLAFLLIYFGVRSYRDNVGHGLVSFGRAFAVASLIGVIASACYVATWEVIYFNFATDYLDKYQARELEKVRASGATQAVIDQKVAEMRVWAERYKNPVVNSAITFLEPLPVWLIMSLVTAAILRTRRDERVRGLATVA